MNNYAEQAVAASRSAHAPYSGFHVGAVVVAEDGRTWRGCNVENAAYGSSVCAEVNALTTAAAEGYTGPSTIYVACPDATHLAEATPCGGCRQVMNELGVTELVLTIYGFETKSFDLGELLPVSFVLPEPSSS
jgi:cytidine deaminase